VPLPVALFERRFGAMNWSMRTLALGAFFITPLAYARECSAPPVRKSEQAVCYAISYAEKNGLSHGPSFRKKVTKGRAAWTIRFVDTRRDARGGGWEVDVDRASGTATRFASYKGRER
jgi:hypothetical protein